MKYEICPKCKKKGLHQNLSEHPIQLCITPDLAFKCRYCEFHESEINNLNRLQLKTKRKK